MISFDEAFDIVVDHARPLGKETVLLGVARGRTLAKDVVAQVDAPPADVSAMDGYAVRKHDLVAGLPLRLVGESYPGAGFMPLVVSGTCVRIFTGAPVPPGADRVILQEMAERDGDKVYVSKSQSDVDFIRLRASDFQAGETLLTAGRILDPKAMVAAAAADIATLKVWRRPRVTILCAGDELAAPGLARGISGSIPESLSYGVAALAEDWGAEFINRCRLRDDPGEMEAAAAKAIDLSDLIVMAGGASVGEKDFSKNVFAALGLEFLFSKVAIKPGKPVWFGRAKGRLVLGLPGNPTSALVTARLFLAPLIAGLSGRDASDALCWGKAQLGKQLPACGDRETFVRGRWKKGCVEPLTNQDSGVQGALAGANLLIRRPANIAAAEVGETVDILDF